MRKANFINFRNKQIVILYRSHTLYVRSLYSYIPITKLLQFGFETWIMWMASKNKVIRILDISYPAALQSCFIAPNEIFHKSCE